MDTGTPTLVQSSKDLELENLATEVPFVELSAEHSFEDPLQLCERKFLWQKLEPDRRPLELVAEAHEGIVQDLTVVEGEPRGVIGGKPARVRCIVPERSSRSEDRRAK